MRERNRLYEDDEPEMLVEMARMNVREGSTGVFPFNRFDIWIWSDDHRPPHIHLCEAGGTEVRFRISTGETIEKKSPYLEIAKGYEADVKRWLDEPSALAPSVTNREACKIAWIQNNGTWED